MASMHGTPAEGAECASCMEDLSDENYAEYQATEGGPWLPSVYCSECLDILLSRKWDDWKNAVINTKCEAEWRRLMKVGPPVNLRDPKALPCPDDGEIVALWFMSDGQVHSAKLQGSLEGEERLAYWNELLQFKPSPKHGEVDPDDEAEEQEQG